MMKKLWILPTIVFLAMACGDPRSCSGRDGQRS